MLAEPCTAHIGANESILNIEYPVGSPGRRFGEILLQKQDENVALFDLDGTLCDFENQIMKDMEQMRSEEEPKIRKWTHAHPKHIERRMDAIMASPDWWEKLPRLQLGWDVLEVAMDLGYRIMILTQGPRRNPSSWVGKKLWIDRNLGPDTDITITRDKGLVYGKVLVDDSPQYVERWLVWRKRGLVIMPANSANEDYKHRQVLRYDGTNLQDVRAAMEKRLLG